MKGPSNEQRELLKTYLWGEVQNAKGEIKQLRMVTDNGYKLTVNGSLKMVEYTLNSNKSGYFTPSQLAHNRVIEEVSESNS